MLLETLIQRIALSLIKILLSLLQISRWLLIFLTCLPLLIVAAEETQMEETTINANATEPKINQTIAEPTKDLLLAETAEPKKIEIVKQIRRLNEDGSYTVGYEAGDGTFKIESRDVQGNIKGTFGYVDGDGEIKRVSYSTSNTTQPPLLLPILQTTRFNRTSPTTRRPQPTIIYPKTSSNPTRPTVIQSIPRRRPIHSSAITTTESYRTVSGNLPQANSSETDSAKTIKQFPIFTPRTTAETIKSVLLSEAQPSITIEPKVYHQNGQQRMPIEINGTAATSPPNFLRSTERSKDSKLIRNNAIRRQLNQNYENEQMFAIQQSAGGDTTDVYGGSIQVGTARPLFTTTTLRPRLLPIHSIISSRQKLTTSAPAVHEDQQETTLEATTNRLEAEGFVTSNPIPLLPINENEQRVLERPFLRHQPQMAHFRTREFLRDNPGAPIPIGNQRVLLRYNPNLQLNEGDQYIPRQNIQPQIPPPVPIQQEMQQDKSNIIAIPVQQIPPERFQIYNPYIQQPRVENVQQRIPINEFGPITAPVSTKDLKRLLQQLLVRQNRFQTLMDIRNNYNPGYNQQYQAPLFEPEYRQKSIYGPRSVYQNQFSESRPYNGYMPQVRQVSYNQNYQYQPMYQNQLRNDYRPQDDGYRNEINNFDPAMPYESQRFVPKRRFYRPRLYEPRYEDNMNSVAEANEENPAFLPPEVREALLLKMLMLAINPDFNPSLAEAQPAMTTSQPEYRKKVRNVQILGEEADETKEEAQKIERT